MKLISDFGGHRNVAVVRHKGNRRGGTARQTRWALGARPSGRFKVRGCEPWENINACFDADGEAA
jgi:hypothetical protein